MLVRQPGRVIEQPAPDAYAAPRAPPRCCGRARAPDGPSLALPTCTRRRAAPSAAARRWCWRPSARSMGRSGAPLVFGGDLNVRPRAPPGAVRGAARALRARRAHRRRARSTTCSRAGLDVVERPRRLPSRASARSRAAAAAPAPLRSRACRRPLRAGIVRAPTTRLWRAAGGSERWRSGGARAKKSGGASRTRKVALDEQGEPPRARSRAERAKPSDAASVGLGAQRSGRARAARARAAAAGPQARAPRRPRPPRSRRRAADCRPRTSPRSARRCART